MEKYKKCLCYVNLSEVRHHVLLCNEPGMPNEIALIWVTSQAAGTVDVPVVPMETQGVGTVYVPVVPMGPQGVGTVDVPVVPMETQGVGTVDVPVDPMGAKAARTFWCTSSTYGNTRSRNSWCTPDGQTNGFHQFTEWTCFAIRSKRSFLFIQYPFLYEIQHIYYGEITH